MSNIEHSILNAQVKKGWSLDIENSILDIPFGSATSTKIAKNHYCNRLTRLAAMPRTEFFYFAQKREEGRERLPVKGDQP